MSDVKFTPGPWEVIHEEEDGTFAIGMASYLDDQGCYDPTHHIELYDCIWPEDGEQFEETKANANLIASAPDMYKALMDFVSITEGNGAIKTQAIAALAKADGK